MREQRGRRKRGEARDLKNRGVAKVAEAGGRKQKEE